jgi:hypothetical protein
VYLHQAGPGHRGPEHGNELSSAVDTTARYSVYTVRTRTPLAQLLPVLATALVSRLSTMIITFTCICIRAYVPPGLTLELAFIDAVSMISRADLGIRDRKDHCAAAWN